MRISIAIILLMIVSHVQGQTSLKNISLNFGQYEVGYTHYTSFDSSRTYQRVMDWNNQFIPRPIPVSIWYPAKGDSSSKMSVLDYMRVLKEEEEWEYLPDEFILSWFSYQNTIENQKHLKEITFASSNATKLPGQYPVVIYAPSFQASSIENFHLCEMLASHGYIVISSPSRGTKNRFFEGASTKDMETQARDILFLVNKSQQLEGVQKDQIAVMGFSFGGISNVLASNQNKDIKALVSLDGSIKYQYYKIKKTPFFDIRDFNIPFIHFSQKDIPFDVMIEDEIDTTLNNSFEFFDQLAYSEAYHYKFLDLTHSYFSTLGVLFQTRDPRQDKSDEKIEASYRILSEFTLKFLNSYLKDDQEEKEWLKGFSTSKAVTLEGIKNSKPLRPTFQDFNEIAAVSSYNDMMKTYQSFLVDHPGFEIPEGRLNNLGLQLVFNPNKSDEGIKVLQFAVELYPESSNLFDSLGEALLFSGMEEQALTAFKKSYALDAGNQNAQTRINELSR